MRCHREFGDQSEHYRYEHDHERVETEHGVPGEENLDVVESLRNSKIKLILRIYEGSSSCRLSGFAAADTLNPREVQIPGIRVKCCADSLNMLRVTVLRHRGLIRWKQAVDNFPDYPMSDQLARQALSSSAASRDG